MDEIGIIDPCAAAESLSGTQPIPKETAGRMQGRAAHSKGEARMAKEKGATWLEIYGGATTLQEIIDRATLSRIRLTICNTYANVSVGSSSRACRRGTWKRLFDQFKAGGTAVEPDGEGVSSG